MRHFGLGFATGVIMMLSVGSAGAVPLPSGAKALPAANLKTIMSGKTQASADGRQLYHYAANGGALHWSITGNFTDNGKWTAADGRLCVDANFLSLGDFATKGTGTHEVRCTDYAQAGTAIFQRAAADGGKPVDLAATDWVAFQSAKPDPKDPINLVTNGDTTTAKIKQFQGYLTTPAPAVAKYGQKLNGDAIKTALWGHAQTQVNSNANTTINKIDLDGTLTARRGDVVTGTSTVRVVNDMYCLHQSPTIVERCFLIYKDGNTYSYLFLNGDFNYSFTIQ